MEERGTQPDASLERDPVRGGASAPCSQPQTSVDQGTHQPSQTRSGGLPMYGDLLARVDDVIEFKALGKESMSAIGHTILNELRPILNAQGITFDVEEEAMDEVVRRVLRQGQGVPGLRGAVRSCILSPIVNAALSQRSEVEQGFVRVSVHMKGGQEISISARSIACSE